MQQVLQDAPDPMFEASFRGFLVHANPAWCRMLGRRLEDIAGAPLLSVVHPEDLDAVEAWVERVASGRQLGATCWRIRDDRCREITYRSIEWNGVRLSDDRFVAIGRDVTERVLTEQNLRESQQRFVDIVGAATEFLFELDHDCRFTFVTDRIEKILGIPVEDLMGVAPWELVHGDDQVFVEMCYRRVLDGQPVRGLEHEARCTKGTSVWLSVHGVAVRDDLGRVRGVRGAGQDITRARASRHALREAKEAAESANRAKSAFLANMSHELRTPLTAILGFTELLHEGVLDADERERHIETVQRNGEHLLSLVNDILDLSKIEAGRFELQTEVVDVPALLHEVTDLLDVRARGKGVELVLEVDDSVPRRIESDGLRLRQILVNLVGNALKFTEHGSVRVRVEECADVLHFAVRDTGIGIASEHVDKLFEPFSQVDVSVTRRFGGTGLGLAISGRLASLLGGKISVDSEIGVGSEFVLTIRSVRVEGGERATPQTSAATLSTRETGDVPVRLTGRVLLVEDGPDNQRLIGFLLRKVGLEVAIVGDGQAACDLLGGPDGASIDAVLMDMQMPVMDGYTAVKRLRDRGDERPVIALTAHAMRSDREKCLDAGCDDFLTKPVDRGSLLALLATYLPGRQGSPVEPDVG